ncbi:hypothetical protein LTR95_007689, partial [Oleoguttula sp. CCFEE 5521]
PTPPEDNSPKLQSSSWSRKPPSLANALTPRPDYMQSRQEREAERNEQRRIWAALQYPDAATHAGALGRGFLAEHLRPPEQPEGAGDKAIAKDEKSIGQSTGSVEEKEGKSSGEGETGESR